MNTGKDNNKRLTMGDFDFPFPISSFTFASSNLAD